MSGFLSDRKPQRTGGLSAQVTPMPNVLLVSPQLPYSFWSFRETCKLTGRKTLAPPLGLLTLAGLLPAHWTLRLVDCNTRSIAEDDWAFADVILFGAMIVQRDHLVSLVAEAKRRGKSVAVGGPLVTSEPDFALEAGCDWVFSGEAEAGVDELVRAVEEGLPRGVIHAAGRPDMAASPVPRFDLLALDDYDAISIQTSRGCPFNCEFCDIINLFGRRPRYKNADQVLAELDCLYRLGWRGTVFFCDDNFIGDPGRARELLRRLVVWMKERREPFSFLTQASVNLGRNRELVDLMTEANFAEVFVGVESPDEEVLSGARKTQNVANPLLQSLDAMTRNGLPVLASFILGMDGEKAGAGTRICDFVERLAIPVVMLNMLQVLPNTALWDRLSACGRLLPQSRATGVSGSGMNFVPSRPSDEIMAEYRQLWDYLYEPTRYLARAYRSCLRMRPTRASLGQAERDPKAAWTPKAARETARSLLTLARVVWRQGVKARYRGQFWRQLVGVYRHNPTRMIRYLKTCGFGENMFALRRHVLAGR